MGFVGRAMVRDCNAKHLCNRKLYLSKSSGLFRNCCYDPLADVWMGLRGTLNYLKVHGIHGVLSGVISKVSLNNIIHTRGAENRTYNHHELPSKNRSPD